MNRRGLSLIEVLVLVALASVLLLPLLSLSSRNVEDHQEQAERAVAQNLCMDMVERFKRYGAERGVPAAEQMFAPVELDEEETTLFDKVYLQHFAALGSEPRP